MKIVVVVVEAVWLCVCGGVVVVVADAVRPSAVIVWWKRSILPLMRGGGRLQRGDVGQGG